MSTQFDLCIIGGGAAGLVVAAGGAGLGAKVVLIEKNRLGGDCLWTGCVPSKALLHSARVAHTVRTARQAAITVAAPAVALPDVMARVRAVIATLEPHDSPERFAAMGVEIVTGSGCFSGPDRFEVNGRTISARHFVLATGSRPQIPAIPGLASTPYLTHETLFDLREPVAKLLIIGAGPIGIEMAQAFRRLGSEVVVLAGGEQILPREDGDLAAVIEQQLLGEGVQLAVGVSIREVSGEIGHVQITYSDRNGTQHRVEGSHVLIATGRQPNIEALDLERAGVAVAEGRLVLDGRLRTQNRRILACGDVAGPFLFTHMAEHQAGIVLRNTLFRLPSRTETRAVPWCTFTDPELARVGLSEREAHAQSIPHRVYTFDFGSLDRAVTDGLGQGRAKLITTPRGKILGAAIAGAGAGELIHEYVLALHKNLTVHDLAGTIHIYPTLAQINRRLAEQRLKAGLTPAIKRWIQRLFRLRGGL